MFTARTRALAVQAMERLMAHPIATEFNEPSSKEEEPKKYGDIVKPKALSPIKKKLEEDRYEMIQDWLDDIELVWSNVEHFYESNSHWMAAAGENRRLFAKEKRIFERQIIGNWCGEVYDLRTEVTDLMTKPPEKVRQYADKLGSVRAMKPSQVLLSERELTAFITAGQMLSGDEDHREMIKILTSMQPELETGGAELFIDATGLELTTVSALKEYMTSALEKQGLKYPE